VPADSFAARFTPPRAGTFIYHAHVDDQRQIALGLYGPLVVLEPGATYDPATDHILVFSQLGLGVQGVVGLNGAANAPPIELRAGVPHRLRFINIGIQDLIDIRLLGDSTLVTWRPLAKDGRDLGPHHATRRPATLLFGPGETYDFELSLPRGDYRLKVDAFNDFEVVVRVR
jgi:manganese oxidase